MSVSFAIREFFEQRIPGCVVICPATDGPDAIVPLLQMKSGLTADAVSASLELARSSREDGIAGCAACVSPSNASESCLAYAHFSDHDGELYALVALVDGRPSVVRQLVQNAIESWELADQVDQSQFALHESAMQLAQSFEEQNWLRGFARNVTNFSRINDANEVAEGILQPLGFLLRSQDLFLIVFPEESERSGLVSANYGESDFGLYSIIGLLNQFGFGKDSPPLVRNNIDVDTPDGIVHSVVAVVISDSRHRRGFLVGINRTVDEQHGMLPVYDAEFGSGDVGLLEEAAVLLTTQADNMRLLMQSNDMFLGMLRAMSSTIDARDPYTQGHSERVARLSYDLSKILGLSDPACNEIYLSGILHDIGKIGIPDDVLLKPGALTDQEFAKIKEHPVIGYNILKRVSQLEFTLPGVLHHHERWDGRGYPHGLSGLSIPLMARVMAVADAFDAMTSSRPYRNAMPIEKATRIINEGAGEQWDADVVKCFNRWLESQNIPADAQALNNSVIPVHAPSEDLSQAVLALIQ